MDITHKEVRRHPRWQEQLSASQATPASPSLGVRLVTLVGVLIVATAIGVVLLKS